MQAMAVDPVDQDSTSSEFVSTQFPPYERPVTIQHWQLRDLVHAASGEELYVAAETSTVYYNTARRSSSVAQDLPFAPNAIAYGYGYVAAAGPRSELHVKDVGSSRTVWSAAVGGTTNNALHFALSASGHTELYVCNNDSTVKVFGLPSQEGNGGAVTQLATVRCHSPVNYAALSPNGRHLCCVLDTEQTVIYEPTPTGYVVSSTWQEASDAGMCCGWAPSSGCVASAHQCGTVCVWDARGNRVIQKYKLAGAARNVKFCPGSAVDLLAMAEHEDFVHVVDTRRWDLLQHLAVTGESSNDIAGLSFDPQGKRLFVGLDERVVAFEVNVALRHSFPSGALI